jgi:hypothetical protein
LQSEFRERLNKGLQRTTHQQLKEELAESEVVEDDTAAEEPAPAPKARGSQMLSSTREPSRNSKVSSGGASGDDAEGSSPDAAAGAEGAAEKKAEGPKAKFDSRNFGSWITKNPEDAAELAAKHFKVQLGGDADAWKKHFIALENKRRRMSDGFEQRETAIKAEKEEVTKVAEQTLGAVQPILDVIEAESKGDFPAIDLFIETTFGMSFNDYCTRRLRGSTKETTAERAAKLKAEKLEKELAELKASKAEPVKEKTRAPKVSESWIASELPEDHGVRDLKDWSSQVESLYQDSYDEDTEEYGLTIEDAADKVLSRFLKKRGLSTEPAAKSSKPKPKRKVSRVHDDDDEDERTPSKDIDEEWLNGPRPADLQEATRWALARAARRR